MIGRREFGIAGVTAAAWGALHAVSRADDDDGHHGLPEHFDDCSEACSDCQRECDACAHHCARLLAEGHKQHLKTLGTCLDCADVCGVAAQIVARQGFFATEICKACAEVCNRCAAACEEHPDDKAMARCAKECRECEKACREMVSAGPQK